MRFDARHLISRHRVTGRGLLVTVVAVGVLAGGGAATAFAADPDGGPGTTAPKTSVTAEEAARAALRTVPGGTVQEIERDDENGGTVWEVDVTGRDGSEHELIVDAATAKVQKASDRDDDRDG